MRGLVIINGYADGKKFYAQGERLRESLNNLGVETDLFRNGEVYTIFQNDGAAEFSAEKKYDFCVYLDKDKYLGRMLEGMGLRLFNSAQAVELCDDKMTTYLALKKSGLRFPKTISAPLCYTQGAKPNVIFLENIGQELGFPLVVKKSYSSFGMGVHLVHGMPELKKIAQELLYDAHFFQEYVEESKGRDIRVIVVGGKALGGMERIAKGDEFRSNIELGGTGRKIELKKEYAKAAEKAASALQLDYCGVDLLETQNGPMICEVNSNAFFEGFEAALGIDVAAEYAKYIVSVMKKTEKKDDHERGL